VTTVCLPALTRLFPLKDLRKRDPLEAAVWLWFAASKQTMQKSTDYKNWPSPHCYDLPAVNPKTYASEVWGSSRERWWRWGKSKYVIVIMGTRGGHGLAAESVQLFCTV
jgi:hypothetical protein